MLYVILPRQSCFLTGRCATALLVAATAAARTHVAPALASAPTPQPSPAKGRGKGKGRGQKTKGKGRGQKTKVKPELANSDDGGLHSASGDEPKGPDEICEDWKASIMKDLSSARKVHLNVATVPSQKQLANELLQDISRLKPSGRN